MRSEVAFIWTFDSISSTTVIYHPLGMPFVLDTQQIVRIENYTEIRAGF